MNAVPRHLKRHFYDAANFEMNPQSWAFKPAAAFENAHGLRDIAAYYDFPSRSVEGEHRPLSVFFEHHVGRIYSRAVMDCYKKPAECGFRIERVAEPGREMMVGLRGEWAELQSRNPVLQKVRVDESDALNLYDAVIGAACLFNPDDLNFFLKTRRDTGSLGTVGDAQKIPGYAPLFDAVRVKTGEAPRWVPSIGTLRRIDAQL